MKITDLYDIELKRLQNLDRIALRFVNREQREPLAIQTQTFKDYVTASNENLEDFEIVVSQQLTDIRPRVNEIHLERCESSGIVQCICFEKIGSQNASEDDIVIL